MDIDSVLAAVTAGLIVGVVGRHVIPGRRQFPLWLAAVVGVAAALVGALIARAADIGSRGLTFFELVVITGFAALGVVTALAVVGWRHRPGREG